MATAYESNSCNVSPRTTSTTPKAKVVTFVLHEARIPLRVAIYPHDATESIITTVKNFYGLYYKERAGISFEDERGNTMIARYENFVDHQSVNVRIIENPRGLSPSYNNADGYHGDEENDHYASRPTLRTSRFRSPSPNGGRGRRSTSTAIAGKKGRSRSSKTTHGDHGDSVNGYSSGDGASGSVSGKNKEPIGNTDISVENIVEGGRRKRAKLFESSELPLFAPPQMPAAASNHSFSPIRHSDSHRYPPPFSNATQNPFSNPRPLQTPPNYHNHYAASSTYATPAIDDRRARGSISYDGSGVATGARTILTPDPTVRSCVSEEDKDIKDVAMQLMQLQGGWNPNGRSSGSTLDDTFSGRADASCSTGTTSDCESESEDEMPLAHTKADAFRDQSVFQTTESHFAVPQDGAEVSGDDADYEDGDGVEEGAMAAPKLLKNPKPRSGSLNGSRARSQPTSKPKAIKTTKPKSKKTSANPVPMTPASMPASRKQSIVSTSTYSAAHGEEEQPDLSTKPRCQRCRKSKKGCDRQRPCGRCKDAGIPAEQCISEDEGNGRKGRYGRHMGVPVPVNKEEVSAPATLLPAALIAPAGGLGSAPNSSALDKSKKRKR